MACLDPRSSALDTLDQVGQLGGLSDFFSTAFSAIGKAGDWVSTNQQAITNIIDAAGRLKAQAAYAKASAQASYDSAFKAPTIPAGLTPAQWQAMQTANVYSPTATLTTSPYLVPGLLAAGVLLVILLTGKRGGDAHA
ncbi:MAG TPA: hypothetical protein VFT46_04290 [Holophagaceae bacterium]|nr:hypothetical protein [Holophagaceae bacterium]